MSDNVIDVYPVGVLEALKHHRVRGEFQHLKRHLRERDWNAIKNSFNGYLAEPREWPEGLRRCGSGWMMALPVTGKAFDSLNGEQRYADGIDRMPPCGEMSGS